MATDILLNLPENRRLLTLDVVSEFSAYNDLMQRCVVLLLMAPPDSLKIAGNTLASLMAQGNGEALMRDPYTWSTISNELTKLLCEDTPEVHSVSVYPTSDKEVNVDIQTTAGTTTRKVLMLS